MSVASKLTTLNTLVNNIKAKLRAWNRLTTPGPGQPDPHGLEDCWDAINNISGTQYITNTNVVHVVANGKVDAQVSDTNLTPNNIVSGVTILGVTGTGGGAPSHLNTDLLTINYGTADSIDKTTMAYDVNLDYFTGVKLEVYPDSNPNKTLRPENIKDGVTILGVQGTFALTYDDDNRDSGYPVTWPTARDAISFDIPLVDNISINDFGFFYIYATYLNNHPLNESSSGTPVWNNKVLWYMMRDGDVVYTKYNNGYVSYNTGASDIAISFNVYGNKTRIIVASSQSEGIFLGNYKLLYVLK